jgi:hypothetical protein
MNFDPALVAREALARAVRTGELGTDAEAAEEADEIFSSSADTEASAAYTRLHDIGARHPQAISFYEYLVYITWQQVTEVTVARYFLMGADLCEHYLGLTQNGHAPATPQSLERVTALRESYRAGLGLDEADEDEYRADAVKGGD